MNRIIKNSIKKHEDGGKKEAELNIFKQEKLYPKIMQTRFQYFEKLAQTQSRGRRLDFENAYEADARLSEMKLWQLK